MIITNGRVARSTLFPTYWFGDFAAYRSAGGFILAHIPTGDSTYFQPGDDAAAFEQEADAAMAASSDDNEIPWNNAMREYRGAMLARSEAGGAPSSDGGFWAFFA